MARMDTFKKLQRSVYTNNQILSSQGNYIWAFHFRFRNAPHMIHARYLKNLKQKNDPIPWQVIPVKSDDRAIPLFSNTLLVLFP